MSEFKKQIQALTLAAPWAILPRFKNFNQCILMSFAGMKVLQKRRIKAKMIPCAVVAKISNNIALMAGHNSKTLYSWLSEKSSDTPPPFEEFEKNILNLPNEKPIHVILRADYKDRQANIDTTLAQIKTIPVFASPEEQDLINNIPPALCWFDEKWPCFELKKNDDSFLAYMRSPLYDIVPEIKKEINVSGLIADLETLMKIALSLNLDGTKFRQYMMTMSKLHGHL